MPPFLYRCPNTGDNVQAWAADDPEDDDLTYIQVTCLACAQAHLVNPKTGRSSALMSIRCAGFYAHSHSARRGHTEPLALQCHL
jgi:hypothetical protein